MSQRRALNEIERFLSTSAPEVLSISGRWGVGKTYAWDETLQAKRHNTPLRRYSYVSVFGLRSLDALKTAIVQSTVNLDGNELEPTLDSFIEHVSSFAGLRKMGEETVRKGFTFFSKGASALPYVGKLADLLAPGAALLIRNQIVCIDDIERAGQGLDVADILGLVSSLRERRGCKVVLLLNEDGLGAQGPKFREYLEKVVDQAVKFEPTAEESANAALDNNDPWRTRLAECAVKLGVTNIRVIRRIRRFLSHIEQFFEGLNDGIADEVIHSIVLLGWSTFEPEIALNIERIKNYNRFTGFFGEDNRSPAEKRVDQALKEYKFAHFDKIDEVILDGLTAGAFNNVELRSALEEMDRSLAKNEIRAAIGKPWSIYEDSLQENTDEFLEALVVSIEKYSDAMAPSEASDALGFLRELGRPEEADRLLPIYVNAQDGKPREFFAARHDGHRRAIDPALTAAFEQKLATMPLVRDPAEILLDIGRNNGWSPQDVDYLSTVPVNEYRAMIKRLRGSELHTAIAVALRFGDMEPASESDLEVASRMTEAITLIAAEAPLNNLRVRPYLK